MRRKVIAGNWKMNMTPSQAKALIEETKPLVAGVIFIFQLPAITFLLIVFLLYFHIHSYEQMFKCYKYNNFKGGFLFSKRL